MDERDERRVGMNFTLRCENGFIERCFLCVFVKVLLVGWEREGVL